MIYVTNTTRKHALRTQRVRRTAAALLAATGRPGATLSVTFVGNAAMRRLNREYRRKDRTTDVLSFPLYDPFTLPKRADAGQPELLVGDIVISLDVAARQAAAYDVTLEAEISRLLIHGLAHLLGHDHEESRERARMLREEKRLARTIGLTWPYDAPGNGVDTL